MHCLMPGTCNEGQWPRRLMNNVVRGLQSVCQREKDPCAPFSLVLVNSRRWTVTGECCSTEGGHQGHVSLPAQTASLSVQDYMPFLPLVHNTDVSNHKYGNFKRI